VDPLLDALSASLSALADSLCLIACNASLSGKLAVKGADPSRTPWVNWRTLRGVTPKRLAVVAVGVGSSAIKQAQ